MNVYDHDASVKRVFTDVSPAPIFPTSKGNRVKTVAFFWAALGCLLCSSSWGADLSKMFETPTAYTLPTRVTIAKEDTIWFIESNLNKIGRFQPAEEVFSEYTIPTPSSAPTDIAISKTGKIWFTESDSDQLGVLDPVSLAFKEYNIPTILCMPSRIATDKYGNIWFTEFYGNKIGMFDPQKEVFKEFAIPTPESRPSGIAVDKKGIVWFVETEGNKLARLNPKDGVIQEFELPTPHQTPREVAIDASGSLWVAGNIGRDLTVFNPATKKFRTFVLPNNSVIESMAVANSGIIYSTLKTSGKISAFDPKTSSFLEFEVGVGKSKPIGISTDSKGDIWFADKEKNALIRLDAGIVQKLWIK